MHPVISSLQNPKIKALKALEKASERKRQNKFIVEGVKELTLALASGYRIQSLFYCPELVGIESLLGMIDDKNLLIPVTPAVFEKLAYRGTTGGVVAMAERKEHTLSQIKLGPNPIVLVIESVEKPGNLGALLRTSDAAGVDAVIICDPLTDFYNPNVVRSSVGCVFSNQIASATTEEAIRWLKGNHIKIFCASLDAAVPYTALDFTGPSAIVMGTESTGLSTNWTLQSDQNIIIPMRGKIDSMNVSTAAAVLIFEAVRQRNL
jgi:TrmH family RNA methyltransferase